MSMNHDPVHVLAINFPVQRQSIQSAMLCVTADATHPQELICGIAFLIASFIVSMWQIIPVCGKQGSTMCETLIMTSDLSSIQMLGCMSQFVPAFDALRSNSTLITKECSTEHSSPRYLGMKSYSQSMMLSGDT